MITGALGWACFSVAPLHAQDPVQTELAALRKLIEQQNDQIARLTTEVARLNALIDTPHRGEASAPHLTPAPAVAAAPAAEAPRPNVLPPANVHVVVKGDSLDKIAKEYGLTAAELQKLNKISDPKKLQIGQQLVLPPTAKKAADKPADEPADKPADPKQPK